MPSDPRQFGHGRHCKPCRRQPIHKPQPAPARVLGRGQPMGLWRQFTLHGAVGCAKCGRAGADRTVWLGGNSGTRPPMWRLSQFCSDPVEAVSIPAAAWRVSWAIQLVNASATFKWSGVFLCMPSMGTRNGGPILSNDATTPTSPADDERTVDYLTTGLACELLTGGRLRSRLQPKMRTRAAPR